jgi:hypothetical protein
MNDDLGDDCLLKNLEKTILNPLAVTSQTAVAVMFPAKVTNSIE